MVFIFPDFIFQISLPKVSLGKQNMESFHVFLVQCVTMYKSTCQILFNKNTKQKLGLKSVLRKFRSWRLV